MPPTKSVTRGGALPLELHLPCTLREADGKRCGAGAWHRALHAPCPTCSGLLITPTSLLGTSSGFVRHTACCQPHPASQLMSDQGPQAWPIRSRSPGKQVGARWTAVATQRPRDGQREHGASLWGGSAAAAAAATGHTVCLHPRESPRLPALCPKSQGSAPHSVKASGTKTAGGWGSWK